MKYVIVCCNNEPLAILNVRYSQSGSTNVSVETVAHRPHMRTAVNPVIDGKPMWDPNEFSKLTHEAAAERNVTEIDWGGHRSWIIRCSADCPTRQQAQINAVNLPAIAKKVAEGKWLETMDEMPVIPLGVLSYLTDPRNR